MNVEEIGMRTRIGTTVVLIALAAAGCGKARDARDAADDGSGRGGAGSSGGAGRGGTGGGGGAGDGAGGSGGGVGGVGGGATGGRGGAGGIAGRGGTGGGAAGSGGTAGQGGAGGSTCGQLGQPCCPGAGGGTCQTGLCVALAGPPIGAAPTGGNGGGAGRGGAGGSGGAPAGVSYLGCTYGGGIDRVVVSKRDTAANQCLSVALASPVGSAQPTPGLDLPAGWRLEGATVGPAATCPTRWGTPLAGEITGTISWAELLPGSTSYPARANADVTVTTPASDGGAAVSERIEGRAINVTPACDSAVDACWTALPIRCGDRLNDSTVTQGRANQWSAYGRTARLESGRETVYAFASAGTCTVTANLRNLTTDLDLLLLSACDPVTGNVMASATPLQLQSVETVQWTNLPDQTHYLVVDGYSGAEGSYTLELDCICP